MKKHLIIFGLINLLITSGITQNSGLSEFFYMNGNKLRLSLTADGNIAAPNGLALEWPIGSGHEYLDNLVPFIISGEQTPQVLNWQADNAANKLFFNHAPEDWPADWQGEWPGYKGSGVNNADLELYSGYNNSAKNLSLTLRIWQWNHFITQDFVIVFFELTNNSSTTYNDLAFGFFANPDVGGDSDGDIISVKQDDIIIFDDDEKGVGSGIAKGLGGWGKTGILSFSFLEGGINSFNILNEADFDLNNASTLWSYVSSATIDGKSEGNSFVYSGEKFSMTAGEIKKFVFAVIVSANERNREQKSEILKQIKDQDYAFTLSPVLPKVNIVAKDQELTLYWDSEAENDFGFEGYKIFKSSDPGFNDVYTVTDDHGNLIYHDPEKTFDLDNDINGLFPLHYNGFRFNIGKDSGLKHQWTDLNVKNGKTYYYSVVAFTRGNVDSIIYPAESMKRFLTLPNGEVIRDDNTVFATPLVEALGFEDESVNVFHENGIASGDIQVDVIDRSLVRNNSKFKVTFDDTSFSSTTYTITDISDPQSPVVMIQDSDNFSFEDNLDENDPLINGMHIFLFDSPLEWNPTQTKWINGNSNWGIELVLNSNLGPAEKVAADYEIRFAELGVDTALFTTPIPIPFEVWNVTDVQNEFKENVLILDDGDGEWTSGELIYIVEGNTIADFRPIYWSIILTAPADTNIVSMPPVPGDVAQIKTTKPFNFNDSFIIETTAFSTKSSLSKSDLEKIIVVPNPYVIHSEYEQKSMYTGGNFERRIQFRNLPLKCEIRIFDLRGTLLRKIDHQSVSEDGTEFWDLKTKQGDTVAYGVYIFHIDAPGIGNRTGRFGIIR